MEDIFRKDDGSTITEGRRKIYEATQALKLLLPNGKDDGVLDIGDLVYVAKKSKKDNKENYHFMVLKFSNTDKQKTIYTSDSDFFKKHIEDKNSVDGETTSESKSKTDSIKETEKKKNYTVPVISSLGFGFVGYLLAKKYAQNSMVFGIGGMVLGAILGHYIANKGMTKSEIITDKK